MPTCCSDIKAACMAVRRVVRRRDPPGTLQELAFWDQGLNAVRVPVVVDVDRTVSCLVTRPAMELLAQKAALPVRECFKVLRSHSATIAALARAKVEQGAVGEVVIEPLDIDHRGS